MEGSSGFGVKKTIDITPLVQTVRAYRKAGDRANLGYRPEFMPDGVKPLKNKKEVVNVNFGRTLPTLRVDPDIEPVMKPRDMTRQIPRFNETGVRAIGSAMEPGSIHYAVNHVPRRKPVVVHGVNALTNSEFGIIQGEAEYFGAQQAVGAVTDSLNEDRLDTIKKDMTRIQKSDVSDVVDYVGGLHGTQVRRTRTRAPKRKEAPGIISGDHEM